MTSSAPRRARRSQRERSAETRAKVIRAATECVTEFGFRGATMSAIAQRGGVTWGAIQHQFGDKEAILDAVLEHSLEEFERGLGEIGNSDAGIEARVHAFTAKAEKLMRGHSYRAFFEIQSNRGREADRDPEAHWNQHVAHVLSRTWKRAFGDLDVPARALAEARRFSFMVLAGIASESLLFPGTDFCRQHLRTLEQTLLRLLTSR